MSIIELNLENLLNNQKYPMSRSQQRVPMRKPMSMVQYWVNTGKHPYIGVANNKSHLDSRSSLAEDSIDINEDSKCKDNIINSNLDRHSEITEISKKKYFRPVSSSSSSVDTAAYILANNNTTKKAEILAIVKGSKTVYSPSYNFNNSKITRNPSEIDKNEKNLSEGKSAHDTLQDSETIFDVTEFDKSKRDRIPRKKLYNNTESPAEFTPVSEENFNYKLQTPKRLARKCGHPALESPKYLKRQSSFVKHRLNYKRIQKKISNINSTSNQKNQNKNASPIGNHSIISTPKTFKTYDTNHIEETSQKETVCYQKDLLTFKSLKNFNHQLNKFKLKSPRLLLHKLPFIYEKSKSSSNLIQTVDSISCNKKSLDDEKKSPTKHSIKLKNLPDSISDNESIIKSCNVLFNKEEKLLNLMDDIVQTSTENTKYDQIKLNKSTVNQKEINQVLPLSEKSTALNVKHQNDQLALQEFSKYTVVFSSDESEVILAEESVVKINLNKPRKSKVTAYSKTVRKKEHLSALNSEIKDEKSLELLTRNKKSNFLMKTESSLQNITENNKNMVAVKNTSKPIKESSKHPINILNNKNESTKNIEINLNKNKETLDLNDSDILNQNKRNIKNKSTALPLKHYKTVSKVLHSDHENKSQNKDLESITKTSNTSNKSPLSPNPQFLSQNNTLSYDDNVKPIKDISKMIDRPLSEVSQLSVTLNDGIIMKNKSQEQILQKNSESESYFSMSLDDECVLTFKSKCADSIEHNNFNNDLSDKQNFQNSFLVQQQLTYRKRKSDEQLTEFSNEKHLFKSKKKKSFKNINNQDLFAKKMKKHNEQSKSNSKLIDSKLVLSTIKVKEKKLLKTKSKKKNIICISSDEECIIPMKISSINHTEINKNNHKSISQEINFEDLW